MEPLFLLVWDVWCEDMAQETPSLPLVGTISPLYGTYMTSRSKHVRPGVALRDCTGTEHVGVDVRFQLERTGLLRRTVVECAYLLDSAGVWNRIGPIREMSFT